MRTKEEIIYEAIDIYKSRQMLEVLLDIRDELVELRKELPERDMSSFVKEVRRGMGETEKCV